MSALSFAHGLQDRLRLAGRRFVFGDELDRARTAHWQTQWLEERAISEMQWQGVREIVRHAAAKSPFYRMRWGQGFRDVPANPENFARIAPLRRADLIAHGKLIACRGGAGRSIARGSGGSTGLSVHVPVDTVTYSWYIATLWRGLQWWETDITQRGAILLGPGTHGISRIPARVKDWMMNWLRLSVDDRFDRTAPEILDRIRAFSPAFVYGYPSAVDRLALTAMTKGWHPQGLKVVVLTGEPVYDFQRNRIADVFRCPVVQEYGSGELGCMAFQCREGTLHITAENVYLEAIPPEGVLLVTHLRNFQFPLIRYETGDVGVVGAQSCRCGRGLPSLNLLGRREDHLIGAGHIRSGYPILNQFFNRLPSQLQGRVRLIHKTPNSAVLQVERNGFETGEIAEAIDLLASILGTEWHVAAAHVDQLARLPSGKLPYLARSTKHL